MEKEVRIIGLGKMGAGLAQNLLEKGWNVIGYNRSREKTDQLIAKGLKAKYSIKELIGDDSKQKVVWLMLTAGEPTQDALFGDEGLIKYLKKGDIIIEGGNSFFENDAENAKRLKEVGIEYVDVGVSGGPSGARNGACCMIGGDIDTFMKIENIFKDLSIENGYKFFEGYGAGHFVKMVHNGIEYGMMQAIAEGFNVMKSSKYNLNLIDVADIYNNGSVIESRLVNWLKDGYIRYGEELSELSGSVAHSGEGLWTVETAKKMNLKVPVIEESLQFRIESKEKPSYTGKILTMLRNMFGMHSIN